VTPSRRPAQKQRAHDLLLCAQCGRFFAKGRGLRDHQQIKHRRDYEAASDAVSDCAKQLSVYRQWTPPALQSHWQSQAQHERTQRAALPPALEVRAPACVLLLLFELLVSCSEADRASDHNPFGKA
jgi:hypothetical protein